MEGVGGFLKSGSHCEAEQFRRFPLRRIQPVFRRFLTIFQLNLDRLLQHRQNIEKFSIDSDDLNRELVYCLRSVEQLVTTVKQLKQTRFQVENDDLPALDLQLMEILNNAVLITAQFLVLLNEDQETSEASVEPSQAALSSADAVSLEDMKHCSICTDFYEDPRGLPCMHTFCLKCLQQYAKNKSVGCSIFCPMCRAPCAIPAGGVEALPKNFLMSQLLELNRDVKKCAISEEQNSKSKMIEERVIEEGVIEERDVAVEKSFSENENVIALEKKLLEFNDLIQSLFLQIQDQDDGLTSISATTATEVQQSSLNLSNFKLLLLPVAGAVIGGAIAGPVGLVAGLKAGKVAAVGGGLLGLTGGTFLKRRKTSERSVSVDEMPDESVELCQVRSTSSPSISTCQQCIGEDGHEK